MTLPVTPLFQTQETNALDKLISHGLDAVTSDILIQDLVIACPLAQLVTKVCFSNASIVQSTKIICGNKEI